MEFTRNARGHYVGTLVFEEITATFTLKRLQKGWKGTVKWGGGDCPNTYETSPALTAEFVKANFYQWGMSELYESRKRKYQGG